MQKNFAIKFTKPIVGKRFGVFQHIMKGAGSEKVDMRKYSSGDSASQINRKISAKYQELYTNVFQQEKSLSLDMFFDINYNRRGGKIPNGEQVRSYARDIISYCHKQQINTTFFYPLQRLFFPTKLGEKVTRKNLDEMMESLQEIFTQVKKTKKIYQSLLSIFLSTILKNKQRPRHSEGRRAIVIFSDFLSMDEETKKLLHYLRTHHILFLFQIPIDQEQGQNYSKFFLKRSKNPIKKATEIELLQID